MSFYSLSPIRFGGTASMVTATLGPNDPEIGTRCYEGGNEYVFVYNGGGSQISIGAGATAQQGATSYSCTVTSTVAGDLPLGVCYNKTLTTATYGWLLTRGIGKVIAATSTALVSGDVFMLGDNGVWAVKSVTSGAAGNVHGKCLTATASAGIGTAIFSIY